MKFSENPHSQDWLHQFKSEDRNDARILLDSLKFVPSAAMLGEIRSQIENSLRSEPGKVAIFPIRELFFEDEVYFPEKDTDFSLYGDLLDRKVGFLNDVQRKTGKPSNEYPPIAIDPMNYHGSESMISSLITRVKRSFRSKVLTSGANRDSYPSLKSLREEKCKCIYLVDDVIGSGSRLDKFVKSVLKNKTIKSWFYGGFIKIKVICYFDSGKYKNNYSGRLSIDSYDRLPLFYDLDRSIADRVDRIAKLYSNSTERSVLGFGNTFARVIFEHSVPNNTPAILWRDVRKWKPKVKGISSSSWSALFPNRIVPQNYLEVLVRRRLEVESYRNLVKRILLEIESAPKSAKSLGNILGIGTSKSNEILKVLVNVGFIDEGHRITNLGIKEISYLERFNKKEVEEYDVGNYYGFCSG